MHTRPELTPPNPHPVPLHVAAARPLAPPVDAQVTAERDAPPPPPVGQPALDFHELQGEERAEARRLVEAALRNEIADEEARLQAERALAAAAAAQQV